MSSPSPFPGAGGMLTGFTRLSKGLAVLLVTGFTVSAIFPSAADYVALVPGKFIPFVWNILTAGYLETSIVSLVVSIISLLFVGKLLEPVWGSREFLKFIVFVNFYASASTFVLAIFLYYLTRQGIFLYIPISGFHGVLAGFLVALKQIMPDQEISSLVVKFRTKWLPSLLVTVTVISSFFAKEPILYVPFIVFGTYGGWLYLRYFQRKPEAGFKGDASAEFAFTTFFPGFMQPFVNPISTIFEKVFCGRRGQPLEEGQGYVLGGKPLPGSDPVEATRRRERGARALEERLTTSSKEDSSLSEMNLSVGPPSKAVLEAVGSEDNV